MKRHDCRAQIENSIQFRNWLNSTKTDRNGLKNGPKDCGIEFSRFKSRAQKWAWS